MVVFPNLRKEWMPFVHLIASNIGTVLETYDKPRQVEEKTMGSASAKNFDFQNRSSALNYIASEFT